MILPVQSHQRIELIDITAEVQRILKELPRVSIGICHLFVRHTTAGITINESADPDVRRDLIDWLNRMAPHQAGYRHREGNSDAHIKSSLVGVSATIPIENNQLLLGTWQGIFFCEFDGPRKRSIHIDVLSSPLPLDVQP
ncbi:MAG: secondary thiamine-phosphate synthase enzyme YjbQ [Thermodesulfobacteriota bacterium]